MSTSKTIMRINENHTKSHDRKRKYGACKLHLDYLCIQYKDMLEESRPLVAKVNAIHNYLKASRDRQK